jgi:rare lipoprotein A
MTRAAVWIAAAILAGCAAEKTSPPVERQVVDERPPPPAPPPPPADRVVKVLRGKAIWYGADWQGKRTASGERFDKEEMTAAHRSLPFGTRVRVTNLENDREVVVRINDRGPFGRDRSRVIDVSEAAARQLDFAGGGEIRVKLEVLESTADAGAQPQ